MYQSKQLAGMSSFNFHAKTILTMDAECCSVSFFVEVSQRQLTGWIMSVGCSVSPRC